MAAEKIREWRTWWRGYGEAYRIAPRTGYAPARAYAIYYDNDTTAADVSYWLVDHRDHIITSSHYKRFDNVADARAWVNKVST